MTALPLATQRTRPKRGDRALGVADVLAVAVLVVVVFWLVAPAAMAGHDPLTGVPAERFSAPSGAHWFGTDELGRDVFSRVTHGTRETILGAGIAATIGLVAGTTVGVVSAWSPRLADLVLMRGVDVILALPGFLVALMLVAALGPSTATIAVAIGFSSIAVFARVSRAEVLRVRSLAFVEAGVLAGAKPVRSMLRDVLPNSAAPVLALVAIDLSASIVMISSLGFLGYGTPPPQPEWGVIIADGRNYLMTSWWISTLPGIVLVAVVLAFARVSRFFAGRRALA